MERWWRRLEAALALDADRPVGGSSSSGVVCIGTSSTSRPLRGGTLTVGSIGLARHVRTVRGRPIDPGTGPGCQRYCSAATRAPASTRSRLPAPRHRAPSLPPRPLLPPPILAQGVTEAAGRPSGCIEVGAPGEHDMSDVAVSVERHSDGVRGRWRFVHHPEDRIPRRGGFRHDSLLRRRTSPRLRPCPT